MNETKKELADIILRFMSVHSLNQKEMAQRLEVSEPTLSEWLSPSKHGITRKNAARIKFVCRDVIMDHNNVNVSGNGNHIESISQSVKNAADSVEKFRRAAMDAVMCNDKLPDEAKAIVYSILKSIEA